MILAKRLEPHSKFAFLLIRSTALKNHLFPNNRGGFSHFEVASISKGYTLCYFTAHGVFCFAHIANGRMYLKQEWCRVMDFIEIYHFLFETPLGIGIMVGASLVICIIVCIIWEIRTRKVYQDRGPAKDEWALFGDDEEED